MADFTGTKIQDTFKRLIQLTGSGQVELSGTPSGAVYLTDGAGNSSVLSMSQSRIGVNTTSPADIVHIYDAGSSAGLRIDSQLPYINFIDNNAPTGGAGNFRISTDGTDDSNVGAFIVEDIDASLASQGKPFIIQTGADTNSLYIQADNKIGIGTSTPAKALDVAGDIGLTGDIYVAQAKNIYFDSTDTKIYADATGDEKLYIEADSDIVLAPDVNLVVNATAIDVNSATIDTSTQTVTVEVNQAVDSFTFDGAADNILSINGTNNRVGIGTAAPDYELQVGEAGVHGTASIKIEATNESLLHFGDAGTVKGRIGYNHGSEYMEFITNSSEAMRIDSTGMVGIGTASPAADLHVVSADDEVLLLNCTTTYSSGSSGPYIGLEGNDSNADNRELARIKATSTGANIGDLQFQTRSSTTPSTKMAILNSGKVGIGTVAPAEMLEVYNATAPAIQLNDGGDYKGIIRLNGNDLEIRGSSGKLELYNGSADGDSSAIAVTIDSNQKVGIGTATPDLLFVVSDGGVGGIEFSPDTEQNIISHVRRDTDAYTESLTEAKAFTWSAGTSPAAAMTIDLNKRVGIGTTAPTHNLDVEGNSGIHIWRDDITSPQADMGWSFSVDNSPAGDLRITQTDTHGQNNEEMMRITDAGNVGIGTADPGADTKLQVNGAIGIYGNTTVTTARGFYMDAKYESIPNGVTRDMWSITFPITSDASAIFEFVWVGGGHGGGHPYCDARYLVYNTEGTISTLAMETLRQNQCELLFVNTSNVCKITVHETNGQNTTGQAWIKVIGGGNDDNVEADSGITLTQH